MTEHQQRTFRTQWTRMTALGGVEDAGPASQARGLPGRVTAPPGVPGESSDLATAPGTQKGLKNCGRPFWFAPDSPGPAAPSAVVHSCSCGSECPGCRFTRSVHDCLQ